MQKVKHRERVQLRRLCCAVTFVAAFYALCAVVSSASGSGPAALRGSVEGALRGDAEAPACDFLLEQHATSPSALAWGALSRAATSSSVDPADEVGDAALLISCLAVARGWRSAVEISSTPMRGNETLLVLRGAGGAPLRATSLTPAAAAVDLARETVDARAFDDANVGRGFARAAQPPIFDVAVVDGALPLPSLLRSAALALGALADAGALVVTRAAPSATTDAWKLVALLRARYDVDAATASVDGGVAVALKRPTTAPLALERLDERSLRALEWPPILPLDSKAAALSEATLPADVLARDLPVLDLLAWADRPDASPRFSSAALRDARDAQHWRTACYGSLLNDGARNARPCFAALTKHQAANTKHKAPNVNDLVPMALIDAATGDAAAAADALKRAVAADGHVAAALLARAATALASAPP